MVKSHSAHDIARVALNNEYYIMNICHDEVTLCACAEATLVYTWPVGCTINILTCSFVDPAGYRGTINVLTCSFVDPAGYRGTINVLTCSFVDPAGYRGTIKVLTCFELRI